jgi:hypothetical protein
MIPPGGKIRREIKDWVKYCIHFTVKNEDSHLQVTVFA